MAAKMRLKKMGRTDSAFYRIVIADESAKRDGKVVETLGFYDPKTSPPTLKVDKKLVDKWVSCGATPTETVRKLLNL